jgi:hypothetical protein
MPKKKRLQNASEKPKNRHVPALERLRTHSNQIITKTIPEIIREYASNNEVPRNERLTALFALNGVISEYCEELTKLGPSTAPSLWKDRDRSLNETPDQFVSRVYHAFIPGIVLADIRRVDFGLYRAYQNYKSKTGVSLDLEIPTKSQATDEMLSVLGINRATKSTLETSFESKLREALRNRMRKIKLR